LHDPAVRNGPAVNIKPEGINAFAIPESNKSPVGHIPAGPPEVTTRLVDEVAVWGVPDMVHLTLSPTEIVVMAAVTMPPVPLAQSTNPISVGPKITQSAGVISPILTKAVAAWAEERPRSITKPSTKNPTEKIFLFLFICIHLLCVVRFQLFYYYLRLFGKSESCRLA